MQKRHAYLALLFVIAGAPTDVGGGGAKSNEELKWARGVATDFLELATSTTTTRAEAQGLLSPELARAIQSDRFRGSFLDIMQSYRYHDAKSTSDETPPGGAEFIFKGVLKGDKEIPTKDATFTMRVAKDAGSGRWNVRMMRVKCLD